MAKLEITRPSATGAQVCELAQNIEAVFTSGSLTGCPVEFASSMVHAAASQSCGKCVPCRIGLHQLDNLIARLLDGEGDENTLTTIEELAQGIYESADCAIGYSAAENVLQALQTFRADFQSHAAQACCSHNDKRESVPCVTGCPAHVDIPGYIALVGAGRYTDAVRLIRKDNPFVAACGLICEHPCELTCRRGLIDAPINIRGLKRFAVEHMQDDYTPSTYEATGKRVAVIGGGPAGMSAAYYLSLMGHKVEVFEQRKYLGGMMRYGIPAYRFPREVLQSEIDWLCKQGQGIEVHTSTSIPSDITFEQLRSEFDAIYIAIGAHTDNKLGIPGEDADGVMSAVDMLRVIGDGEKPDFKGQHVAVVGGGNVAMDVARSSIRLGAASVTIVYRRSLEDMTAQREEIDGAIAEGCELLALHSPTEVVVENGKVAGLRVQKQIPGAIKNGRPTPVPADCESFVLPVDRVLVAAGQAIVSEPFEKAGVSTKRGKLVGDMFGAADIEQLPGVFVGGDCESGPATVIRAVAAGKAAARNIDDFLGFDHPIKLDVEIPEARAYDRFACGRANMCERSVAERKDDFDLMEQCYSDQEAKQEASRCLRCDHFGMGAFRKGRNLQW